MATVEPVFARLEDGLILDALANGHSYTEAAGIAGVSRSTVARRMRDSEFRALVGAERESNVEEARSKIARAAPAAVETLIDLHESAAGESVRSSAARALVEFALSRRPGLNWVEMSEVERYVNEMLDVALAYVPANERTHFLDALTETEGVRS